MADLNGQWIDRFHDRNGLKYIVLDMDSSVSPTHGDQEGSAWNGHFDCTCYHPNFLFNQFGMLERCALRHGNVHSADGWRGVLDPVIARYAGRDLGGRFFRADAAYAIPAIYARLEEAVARRTAPLKGLAVTAPLNPYATHHPGTAHTGNPDDICSVPDGQ